MSLGKALAAGLVILMTLMLLAPAVWLDRYLAVQTRGEWRLSAPQGTVWQGSGQLVQCGANGTVLLLTRLHWRFQVAGLRQMQLRWSVMDQDHSGSVSIGRNGVDRSSLSALLPAGLLLAISPG